MSIEIFHHKMACNVTRHEKAKTCMLNINNVWKLHPHTLNPFKSVIIIIIAVVFAVVVVVILVTAGANGMQ